MKQNVSTHEKLVKRGLRLHESFRYKAALPLFQKAFELTPTCPAAIYNLANTLHMLDREQEAQKLLMTLVNMNDTDLTSGCAELRQPRSFRCDALYLMFHIMLSETNRWSKAFPFAQKHLQNRTRGLKSAWSLRSIRKEIAELEKQFSPI